MASIEQAQAVKKTYGKLLRALPGVTGIETGFSHDTYLVVLVEDKKTATLLGNLLSPQIAGVRVKIEVSGPIVAQ